MLTATQLAERQHYIGASEVAAALGLSRYTSRLELYMRKTAGGRDPIETDAMAFGNLLERHVLDRFERRVKPLAVLRPTESDPLEYASKSRLLRCHLDGLVKDAAVVEAKTARNREGWGEPGSDAAPVDYLLQTQAQMYLTRLPMTYIPVLFRDDLKLEVYETHIDEELVAMIADGIAEFWGFVERRQPPPPDFESPGALEVVKKLHPGTDGSIMNALQMHETWYRALCDAQERAAKYGAAADSLKTMLLWDMQDAAELRFSDGRALRRRLVKRKAYSVAESEHMDCRLVNVKGDEK